MVTDKSSKTAIKLCAIAVIMFGFGYALVPLYNVFCEITGLNGKTGTIAASEAEELQVDQNRLVTVEFDTNINGELPWQFRAKSYKMTVHPGEVRDAVFVVENQSDETIVGQAIPSVAPGEASLYFNKTECFCFRQQALAPHEKKEMLVRFVVDTNLPKNISTMTLSYTFFLAPDVNKKANVRPSGKNNRI